MGVFTLTSEFAFSQVSTGPKNDNKNINSRPSSDRGNNDKNTRDLTPTTTINSRDKNTPTRDISRQTAPRDFNRSNVGRINSRQLNINNRDRQIDSRTELPRGYERITGRDRQSYYHYDGRFYSHQNGRYNEVAPYLGLRINRIPVGHNRITMNRSTFYYYNGVFYSFNRNYYEVVAPPIGTIVNSIPRYSERIFIYGQEYYEYYGTIFMRHGRRYQVVGYLDY